MPQLRSFTGFAPTPNIASATVGAMGVGQRASEVNINAQLEREKLRQQMAIAEMEASAKRAALSQQALMQAQELEVQKAYQQSLLGLKDRELQLAQDEEMRMADEAARKFSAQESMRRSVEEALASGKTPGEAFAGSVARFGVESGAPSSAFSDIIQKEQADAAAAAEMVQPEIQAVPGEAGERGWRYGRTGKGSVQYFPPEAFNEQQVSAQDVPGLTGYKKFGDKLVPEKEPRQIVDLRKKRDRLQEWLDSRDASAGRMAVAKSKDGKLTPSQQFLADEYLAKQKELSDTEAKISEYGKSDTKKTSPGSKIKIRSVRQLGRPVEPPPLEAELVTE